MNDKSSVSQGTEEKEYKPYGMKYDQAIIPLVIIISGEGRCGKDTIIETFQKYIRCINKSAIDDAKAVAKFMAQITYTPSLHDAFLQEIDDKTDAYRALLHDIKMAWVKFNNGSLYSCLHEYVYEILVSQIMNYGEGYAYVHFIHNRDNSEITQMKETFMELGVPVLVMKVESDVTSSDMYHNGCDEHVSEYDGYDITLFNSRNTDEYDTESVIKRMSMQLIQYYEDNKSSFIASDNNIKKLLTETGYSDWVKERIKSV